MRILFDSKKTVFKEPFGTLTTGQNCTMHIHIPSSVAATEVCCLFYADGSFEPDVTVVFSFKEKRGAYDIFCGSFSMEKPALYFYRFQITTPDNSFRLFKYGDDTNMEAGDMWQLTCIPADFTVPEWAIGATIYQIFPDRFYKSGDCDLTGKLEPYTIHQNWDEEVHWQPTPEGIVLNNDFYGGNFRGIIEKLDYIVSLGVTIIYLNPISKSFSSHRYDTGDYKLPDPMLGTIEDFKALCEAAHQRGIRVILDGVYSHTGSNSLYFDRDRTFGGNGAYCSKESPYYSWYTFHHYPDSYNCWWNFPTLPTVNKMDPAFIDYIITSEDSVVAHWLRLGADGFRLDVADELPNEFLALLKKRVQEVKPDALIIGEVWEDASNKIAYDIRKRYFVDGTLDSIMNYPFRTAIMNYVTGLDSGKGLQDAVMTLAENYPRQVFLANMNMLSTHDTPRILTALVDDFDGSREEKARRHLSPEQRELARQRFMMAAILQYTLPGSACLYYADETGMEGYRDPFNRRTYPWGKEDLTLREAHKIMGHQRKNHEALRLGDIEFFKAEEGKIGFTRTYGKTRIRIHVNCSTEVWCVPAGSLIYAHNIRNDAEKWVSINPMGFLITLEEL